MADLSFLRTKWDAFADTLTISSDEMDAEFRRIVTAYSEPQRFYHTVDHLADMFLHLEEVKDNVV